MFTNSQEGRKVTLSVGSWFTIFPSFLSWAGVRHHTSGLVFPVHRVMPSSGGAAAARWCGPSVDESSGPSSSTSRGWSGACGALLPAGFRVSSRRGSSLLGDSTRFLRPSGWTTGRWFVGPSVTRLVVLFSPLFLSVQISKFVHSHFSWSLCSFAPS